MSFWISRSDFFLYDFPFFISVFFKPVIPFANRTRFFVRDTIWSEVIPAPPIGFEIKVGQNAHPREYIFYLKDETPRPNTEIGPRGAGKWFPFFIFILCSDAYAADLKLLLNSFQKHVFQRPRMDSSRRRALCIAERD